MHREVNIKTAAKPASQASRQAAHKPIVAKHSVVRSQPVPIEPDNFFSYNSSDDKNVLAIIDIVRNGISYKDFTRIADDTPFSLTEWANYLQLSERTIQRN